MKGSLLRRLSSAPAACLTAMLMVVTARAGEIDADLLRAMETGSDVDFIVVLSDQLDLGAYPARGSGEGMRPTALLWDLKEQANASQGSAVELLQGGGASRLIQLWSINALAATASPVVINQLAALPGVERIKLDLKLLAPSPQAATASVPEWNLDSVRAPELWEAGFNGEGMVVASMDTGVDYLHPDLANSWRGGTNSWFDPNGEHSTPYDKTGHGTQTTSLMVGGDAGGTSIGVAPGARWIAVKIFNDAGMATLSGIHQGFQWLLDPDSNPATDDTPDVVNNSWGFRSLVGQCYTEFNEDIEVLKTAGIAVVFAAGNLGSLGSESPGDNPAGFAVGAVDSSLDVEASSNRGPSACDGGFFPEVVAPGVNVRAADLSFGGVFPDSYVSVSGTSFAAPHVSGTMALLRQANPDATVAELEQALTGAAYDLGEVGADNESGYGLIDAVVANELLTLGFGPICTDVDGDGFFAEADCGTELDCNAFDASINPGACDIKRDAIDQDCDGEDRAWGDRCPVSGGDSAPGPYYGAGPKRRGRSDEHGQ